MDQKTSSLLLQGARVEKKATSKMQNFRKDTNPGGNTLKIHPVPHIVSVTLTGGEIPQLSVMKQKSLQGNRLRHVQSKFF